MFLSFVQDSKFNTSCGVECISSLCCDMYVFFNTNYNLLMMAKVFKEHKNFTYTNIKPQSISLKFKCYGIIKLI